jgi:hypothetical protein
MLGLVSTLAWPARAQDAYNHVSGGLALGVSFGDRATFSVGLDFRYAYTPEGPCASLLAGAGPFVQAMLLVNGGGVAGRVALGAHGGAAYGSAVGFDGEIGWTYRTAYGVEETQLPSPAWHGLHLGFLLPFMYAGAASIRVGVPLAAPEGAPHAEGTFALGVAFPSPFGFGFGCGTGRPLRVDGCPVMPDVIVGEPQAPGTAPELARAWLEVAQEECASAPTFLELARDLAAVEAPAPLVKGALRAAEEEVGHALLCAAIAARFSGTPSVPELLAVPAQRLETREQALVRLAVESWRDGCIGEGEGARKARSALDKTEDPLIRATLARIAVEEQRHADLAFQIVRFCRARGGSAVSEALACEARLKALA